MRILPILIIMAASISVIPAFGQEITLSDITTELTFQGGRDFVLRAQNFVDLGTFGDFNFVTITISSAQTGADFNLDGRILESGTGEIPNTEISVTPPSSGIGQVDMRLSVNGGNFDGTLIDFTLTLHAVASNTSPGTIIYGQNTGTFNEGQEVNIRAAVNNVSGRLEISSLPEGLEFTRTSNILCHYNDIKCSNWGGFQP